MPFLQVLTRYYKRPNMLAVNKASLAVQTDQDYIQTLLVDDVGRGIGWSHLNMAAYAPKLVGDYIWVLDDDDRCCRDALIAELRAIVKAHSPDVIMVKMDHGKLGILPAKTWGREPVEGDIGCSAPIIRREVWQRYARFWGNRYAGDFDFIKAVWDSKPSIYWYDVIASRIQRRSLGAPE